MSVDISRIPIRMCVVVPREDGRHQAFCIACHWTGRPMATQAAAERQARRHSCRKKGDL
jgi:hypothetical protein